MGAAGLKVPCRRHRAVLTVVWKKEAMTEWGSEKEREREKEGRSGGGNKKRAQYIIRHKFITVVVFSTRRRRLMHTSTREEEIGRRRMGRENKSQPANMYVCRDRPSFLFLSVFGGW